MNAAGAVGLILAILLAALAPALAPLIGLRDPGLLRLAAVLVATQTYAILMTFMLLGLHAIGARNAVLVVQASSYFLVTLLLLAAGTGPAALVVGNVASYLVAGVFGAHRVSRFVSPLRFRLPARSTTRYVTFGLRGQVAQIAQFFSYRLDAMVLGGLVGSTAVGLYAVATSMAEVVSHLSNAAATVAFPRFASSNSDAHQVRRVVRITLCVAAAGGIVLALIGFVTIPLLFGREFVPSVLPFLILVPGTVSLAIVKILSAAFVGAGAPGRMTVATLTSFATAVLLDLALIPIFGVIGAAMASTLAYSVGAVASVHLFRRMNRTSLRELLLITSEDVRVMLRPIR